MNNTCSILLSKISKSFTSRNRPESVSTDWGQTLALYGLLRAYDKNPESEIGDFIRRWLNYNLASRIHFTYFCGSWGFGLMYPLIAKHFPESKMYLDETAARLYDTITEKSLRNPSGVILHNIDLPNIYIDTIYYSAVVLAKIGKYLDKSWQDEALRQLRLHLDVLRDTDSPFYIHCQENMSGHRSQGAWARGNGWVMMTYAELLSEVDHNSPDFALLADDFRHLAANLTNYQRTDGLWGTIITDPDSYSETSASAMYLYAYARGKKLGIFGNEYDSLISNAAKGLESYVDDGICLGVSEGTWPGTIDYYKSLAQGEYFWGTGAFLLAFSELS